MSATGPAFVTPHAVRQFQKRIAQGLDYAAARAAILEGLGACSNICPSPSGKSLRIRVRRPYPFRAVVLPPKAGTGELPVVVTILRSGK